MIVFSGAMSSSVEKKTKDLKTKQFVNFMLLTTLVWTIASSILVYYGLMKIMGVVIGVVAMVILAILIRCVPVNTSHPFYYYYYITIDTVEIVCIDKLFNKSRKKPFGKVKKVIDTEECYFIIFKWGDMGNCMVCQKNLIREGTLEEFEELFKGKIVKEKEKKVFKRKNK